MRGYHYKEDLQTLRHYIREYRPVLIGVDGGADALIEAGHQPDLIVGDMDSVSDDALRCGAEIVVHAYRDGRAPGLERVRALGVEPVVFPATGTSEDVAMLLADDKGASLIVAVGTHVTLVEFLDKGRSGMASTFLTRLRVGGKLVDAKGVSRLYRARISSLQPRPHAHRGAVRPRRRPVVHGRRPRPPAGARRPHRRPVVVHPRSVRLIDFRYHLVSIVSIFLALAVGIVLGAGPLKGELGDTLNKEVAGLRQDKADLNQQLQEANAGIRGARLLHRRDQPDHARRRAPGPPGRARRAPRRGCRGVRGDRRHAALLRRDRGVDDLGERGLGDPDEATAASRDAAVTSGRRPRPGSTSPTAGRWPRATCCSPACSPCRPTTRRRRSRRPPPRRPSTPSPLPT